jgi:hypothetical protein
LGLERLMGMGIVGANKVRKIALYPGGLLLRFVFFIFFAGGQLNPVLLST